MNKYNRQSVRLKAYDYSQSGAYFVTICVNNHECLFGKIIDGRMVVNEYGMIAQKCWGLIPAHFTNTELYDYVVMPNHIHGIINIVGARHAVPLHTEQFGKPVAGSISTILRSYKSAVTKRINEMCGIHKMFLWQRNYYEHVIRDDMELNRIRQYIIENPLKWESDSENPNNIRDSLLPRLMSEKIRVGGRV